MKKYSPKKLSLIKKSLASAITILSASAMALSPPASLGWKVQDGKLIDAYGNPFIFRGVTIDHTLAPEKTVQALKDIAALGANSAQIEFTLKDYSVFPRPIVTEIRKIVETCIEQNLVCVLEPNDVAGFGTYPGSTSPSATIDYWRDIYYSLYGGENNIIIGLGNQHFDGDPGSAIIYLSGIPTYASSLLSALPRGFLVMVDGNVWSQDTDKAMQQIARRINADDYLKTKIIYSVDFFDQYVNPELIRDYIATFKEIGAPLVIGGFGTVPYYHPHFNGPVPLNAPRLPAETVMQYAEQYGAGYFGWSWSGNKNSALDVVIDWNPGQLTAWGNILFNDVNGIKATAKQASVFSSRSSSSSNSSSSSSVSSNNSPIAVIDNTAVEFVRCGEVYGKASALRSTDPDGDTLAYKWTVSGPVMYTSTEPEIRFTMFWPLVDYRVNLEVSDGKGGVSTSSTAMRHSYSNSCPPPQSSSASSLSRSSSSVRSSSSLPPSSGSSISKSVSSSSRSSSSVPAQNNCSYVINSQWGNGFTAAIRIKNTTSQTISGWSVNWQYTDGSKVTNLWNASLTGSNPYSAKNLSWNTNIQPGQTVEFGFQGSKPTGTAVVPVVTGGVCQ